MKVVYRGHSDVLLMDYNGRRFAFHKNVAREVSQEVYNNIKMSRDVEAEYLAVDESEQIVPTSKTTEKPTEKPLDSQKTTSQTTMSHFKKEKRGRHKKT